MAGFWSGFAQGYGEEKDRQEARKQYQDALDLKKKDMILQMGLKRAELGLTSNKAGEGTINTYVKGLVQQFSMDPEKAAALAREGGVTGIKQVYDDLKSNYDEKNPYTPEFVNAYAQNSIISHSGGGSVDMTDLYTEFGVTPTSEEAEYGTLMTTTAPTTTVLTPLPPAAPATMDDVTKAIKQADDMVGNALAEKMDNLQTQMAAPNLTPDESRILGEEFGKYKTAKEQFDNGVTNPAKALVGQDVMGLIVSKRPALAEDPLIQAYGTSTQTQESAVTPTAATQPQPYTDLGKDFATAAEAQAAFDAGQIPPYSKFSIAGVTKWYPSDLAQGQ